MTIEKGFTFDRALQEDIKSKFCYMDENIYGRKRLFFENSSGSLRLKACVEAKAKYEQIPDCPLRYHDRASVGLFCGQDVRREDRQRIACCEGQSGYRRRRYRRNHQAD